VSASPHRENGGDRITEPVLERDIAGRVQIFDRHFQEMGVIEVNVIEVLRLKRAFIHDHASILVPPDKVRYVLIP
jgi:hypothetical protein